jgi:hypothetical protein
MILNLDFYNVRVQVISTNKYVIDCTRRDFSFFHSDLISNFKTHITIEAFNTEPDFSQIDKPLFNVNNKTRYYGFGNTRYVCTATMLGIYDMKCDCARVYCCDHIELQQHVYYMILSKVGEKHDMQGLHRFHSLGISYNETGCVFPMPPKGGKSSLGFTMLKEPDFILYSEDVPLIDRNLYMHSFPVRLSLRGDLAKGIPQEYCRKLNDADNELKTLVDIMYLGESRIGHTPRKLRLILHGIKSKAATPSLKRVNPFFLAGYLLLHLVKGRNFPQKPEYVIRVDIKGILVLVNMLRKRLITAWRIFWRVPVYHFYMSADITKNVQLIKELEIDPFGRRYDGHSIVRR